MKSLPALHFKTVVLILIMVILGPLGNVLLSKGMKGVGSANTWTTAGLPRLFAAIFTSPAIWLGVGVLLAFFVAYMLVLSWADYSYVQPASSVSYGVVALLGYLFLGEAITPLRWLGIAIICLGVLVVGYTPPRTTEKGI
jgi:drug/metabolite transporter (DMT)-like permease